MLEKITIIEHDEIDSTNLEAHRMLQAGKGKDGLVISSLYQTSGRGQRESVWESEYGQNLMFSILLNPHEISAENQFLLSQAISLGIVSFLEQFTKEAFIKWPNDIFVHDKKIAGILIENTLRGPDIQCSIAGIGLNVNQLSFGNYTPPAVSVRMLTEKLHNLRFLLTDLLVHIQQKLSLTSASKRYILQKLYIANLYRYNIPALFKDKSSVFEGYIKGITEEGMLKIEKENGTISKYQFKEVQFMY